ncbi:hypothetical protein CRG98_031627 [Punica granatum]|uniref:Histidine-containing phosphotransfer protein n=1 Tax=Punica granatum TaxID=22663 RepID=A0A2I0IW40_PUNGR|nr:hypothetical protein CRG98_031627 [Punica granatum]
MDVGQMQKRLLDYMNSLLKEGILDSQFAQLQQLQDESNPDFVAEVVNLFFTDSENLINDLSNALYKIPSFSSFPFPFTVLSSVLFVLV